MIITFSWTIILYIIPSAYIDGFFLGMYHHPHYIGLGVILIHTQCSSSWASKSKTLIVISLRCQPSIYIYTYIYASRFVLRQIKRRLGLHCSVNGSSNRINTVQFGAALQICDRSMSSIHLLQLLDN